jgi:hypothetical protein
MGSKYGNVPGNTFYAGATDYANKAPQKWTGGLLDTLKVLYTFV